MFDCWIFFRKFEVLSSIKLQDIRLQWFKTKMAYPDPWGAHCKGLISQFTSRLTITDSFTAFLAGNQFCDLQGP
jgi:hypothetical protein